MASGGFPPIIEKFVKKWQMQSIGFLASVIKILLGNFKNSYRTLISSGSCHVTIIGGVVYKKSMMFTFF